MINREDAKKEIESLAIEGVIHPHAVVNAARDPDSALHDYFTWDDTDAAENWRIVEARKLLRVFVVQVGTNTKGETTRAFVSLSGDRNNNGGYRAIVDVLSDAEMRAQLLQDALDEFESYRLKFETVKELKPIFEAHKKVALKHRKVEQAQLAA